MSPVAGLVRARAHQLARQAVFGTKVAATRRYPFSGTPDTGEPWADPEVDAGARITVANPDRVAPDLTASLDLPSLRYNDLPMLFAAFFGGEVGPTGGGAAKTWPFELDATAVGEPDPFTYEFGDDVTTDWFQFGDGIIETLEITGPEGLGALSASVSWRFGSLASSGSTDFPDAPVVPTAGLSVAIDDAVVYLRDGLIRIASSIAGLAAGQVSDALHTFTLRLSQEIDVKRWANGTQTFDVNAYAGGAVSIELECSWAKTADIVGIGSETDAWMSDTAVTRFVQMPFVSPTMAEGIIPYSWTFTMPMRYYTRTEGESGGNSLVVLTGRAFLESDDFEGAFETTIVNTLTEAELGVAGS